MNTSIGRAYQNLAAAIINAANDDLIPQKRRDMIQWTIDNKADRREREELRKILAADKESREFFGSEWYRCLAEHLDIVADTRGKI